MLMMLMNSCPADCVPNATGHAYCVIMKFLWMNWQSVRDTKRASQERGREAESVRERKRAALIWHKIVSIIARRLLTVNRSPPAVDVASCPILPWLSCDRLHFDKFELVMPHSWSLLMWTNLAPNMPHTRMYLHKEVPNSCSSLRSLPPVASLNVNLIMPLLCNQ